MLQTIRDWLNRAFDPPPTAAPANLWRDRAFGRDEYAPLSVKATTGRGDDLAEFEALGDPRDVLIALRAWLGERGDP